ncbi:uncharacterized protein [Rutidosis leptorrhynchoides]|uniref:uncharacterized protein n=1 Tax=Rutidosis leptorrhynchoides TaxID=125765 RepID=UPI003A99E853
MVCIRQILDWFFDLSGLKMNPAKTVVCGVNVNNQELESFAGVFECNVGSFPFEYLGVPIGAYYRREVTWSPIIKKFRKKLSGWKGRCLSMGGRLIMRFSQVFLYITCPYSKLLKVLLKSWRDFGETSFGMVR